MPDETHLPSTARAEPALPDSKEAIVIEGGSRACGKTTLLRMLAGFLEPDAGRITLRGDDVTHRPPNKRPVNMVFQHYELFPHMTVFANVAYGLRLKKVPKGEIKERVVEMLG